MAGGPAAGEAAFDAGMQALCQEAGFPWFERMEFGSNFCPFEFLRGSWDMKMNMWLGFSARYDVPLTLVVPIVNEDLLPAVKRRIHKLVNECHGAIDEIVVNDFGMLAWVSNAFEVNLVVGRLFSKDLRDPRYTEDFPFVYRPALLSGTLAQLKERYPRIVAAEFDPAGLSVDMSGAPEGVAPALHLPYFYATTGRICEAASLDADSLGGPRMPFKPSGPVMQPGAGGRAETKSVSGNPQMPAVPGSPEIAANPTRLRAETVCRHQCVRAMTTYAVHPTLPGTLDDDQSRTLYYTKRGKTVYCLNDGVRVVNALANESPQDPLASSRQTAAQDITSCEAEAAYDYRLVYTPRHFGWAAVQ